MMNTVVFLSSKKLLKNMSKDSSLSKILDKDIVIKIMLVVISNRTKGVTTRDVSDYCDISIYSARNWLLKLSELGQVYSEKESERQYKWYPAV